MAMSDEKPDMAARYANMTAAEEGALDASLPPGARERESAAVAAAQKVLGAARDMMAKGMLQAAGYRVVVLPIEAIKTLEEAEADVAPTLHEAGFEVKTDSERDRESRGTNHGVVISIGPVAFEGRGGRSAWCDEGDVVVFARYAGNRIEHPPGSGTFYQVMNDEDIGAKVT